MKTSPQRAQRPRRTATEPRGMRQARARRKREQPVAPPGYILALATAIVDRLFTRGDGVRAYRLVLVDHAGRDLGGWAEQPVRDLIIDEMMKGAQR